jgi:hypothetical protein
MKPEDAAVTRLNLVLHFRREDRGIAAVASLAPAEAGKRYPADIRQRARSYLLADFVGRVRRRRHLDSETLAVSSMPIVGFDAHHDSTFDTSSRKGGGEREGSIIAGT